MNRSTRRVPDAAYVGIGVVIIVGAWAIVAETAYQRSGMIPSPWSVVGRLVTDLGDAVVWNAIVQTLIEAGIGFLIGNALAIALAFIVLLVPRLHGVGLQFAVTSSCIPITALAPLVVLLSGPGSRTAAITLAALGVFYSTTIGTIAGLRSSDRAAIEIVTVYGGNKWTVMRKVQVLYAVPSVFAALRIAAPAALVGALLGEFFLSGVDSGLGIMIKAAQIQIDPQPLWSLAFLCALLAAIVNAALTLIFRTFSPWKAEQRGARS
jgi:ABC-type nitrate/sulfonate/bicarbonate transport system permease component